MHDAGILYRTKTVEILTFSEQIFVYNEKQELAMGFQFTLLSLMGLTNSPFNWLCTIRY
jgi:hypothetical protein